MNSGFETKDQIKEALLKDLKIFVEELAMHIEDMTDREYYLFTEIWQKIENMRAQEI